MYYIYRIFCHIIVMLSYVNNSLLRSIINCMAGRS